MRLMDPETETMFPKFLQRSGDLLECEKHPDIHPRVMPAGPVTALQLECPACRRGKHYGAVEPLSEESQEAVKRSRKAKKKKGVSW